MSKTPPKRRKAAPKSGVPYLVARAGQNGVLWRWTPSPYYADGWTTVAFRDPATGLPLDLAPAIERAEAWNENLQAWRSGEGHGPEAYAADPSGWPQLVGAATRAGRSGAGDALTLSRVAEAYRRSESYKSVSAQQRANFNWSYKLIDPFLGGVDIRAITKAVAQELYERLARDGKGHRTLQQAVQTGSRLCTFAALRDWRDGNAFAGLETTRPKPKLRIASWTEEAALLDAARALAMPDVELAILLAVDTGQRLGDLRHMRLADVADGRVKIIQHKAEAAGAIVRVDIPLTPRLAEAVARRRRMQIVAAGAPQPAGTLLYHPETGLAFAHIAPRDNGDRWAVLDKRAGDVLTRRWRKVRAAAIAGDRQAGRAPMASLKGLEFRDFRDTAVTRLADAGCTVAQIAAITGHSLESVTKILRHYLAATPEQADAAMQNLAALHSKILGDAP